MAKFFAAIVILIDFLGALPLILHLWPMPPNISTTGRAIDAQMLETVVEVGALFLAAVPTWLVRFGSSLAAVR